MYLKIREDFNYEQVIEKWLQIQEQGELNFYEVFSKQIKLDDNFLLMPSECK